MVGYLVACLAVTKDVKWAASMVVMKVASMVDPKVVQMADLTAAMSAGS